MSVKIVGAMKIVCLSVWLVAGFIFSPVSFCRAGGAPPVMDFSAIRSMIVDDIDDASGARCNGEQPLTYVQVVTTNASVIGPRDSSALIRITVQGAVERMNTGYDEVYLNEELLFGSDGDGVCHSMAIKTASREFCVQPGEIFTLTYDTVSTQFHWGAYAKVLSVDVLSGSGCSGSSCSVGSGSVGVGSVNVVLDMGVVGFDVSAGKIWIDEHSPSSALSTPAILRYNTEHQEIDVVRAGAVLRQVKTSSTLADIVAVDDHMFEVRFYAPSNVLPKAGGVYQTDGEPFTLWRFENPDADPNMYNRLWVSEISAGATNTHRFEWDENADAWSLTQGAGIDERTTLQLEETFFADGFQHTAYTRSILDGEGEPVESKRETYTHFPWGKELTALVLDPDGVALTTQWFYYHYVATGHPNYRRLKGFIKPNGYWEVYEYNSTGERYYTKSQYKNQPFDAGEDVCRYTMKQRNVQNGINEEYTEYLEDQEVSRRYIIPYGNTSNDVMVMTRPGQAITSTNRLLTRTVQDPSNGRPLKVLHPDGRMTMYDYIQTSEEQTTITIDGRPNGTKTAITFGSTTIRSVNAGGQPISEHKYDIVNPTALIYSEEVTERDELGRPTRIDYHDGTYETREYACCGLTSWRDREGIYTFYSYDDHKRMASETRADVMLLYTYDAADRLIKTERVAGGGPPHLVSSSTYDLAGRRTSTTDALGHVTTYAEELDPEGFTLKTTTYPDNATRIEKYYGDGSLHSISGTAARPVRYEYGVLSGETYVKEIRLGENGGTSEWTRTWTDMAGRTSRMDYSDGTSETFHYNAKGQLDRKTQRAGADILYGYHSDTFELEYTTLDLNNNGTRDLAGIDRITRRVKRVTDHESGPFIWRESHYEWQIDHLNFYEVNRREETTLDGLQRWSVIYKLTNHQQTVYGEHGDKTITQTAADRSFSVQSYSNGLLRSVARFTPETQLLARTQHAYDGFGRLLAITDERNGTTSNTYDAADRLIAITTPPPAPGEPPQTTTYLYDSMGRVVSIAQPDGGIVTNEYYPTGELKKTSGARTYPVAYAYCPQGRLITMTTWHDHAAETGEATTIWQYEPATGLLTNKVYPDNTAVSYTYHPGGRLASRTWARGITTTYGYNLAGDLTSITYSDGTPAITNAHDRLGRIIAVSDAAGTRTLTYTVDSQPLDETHTAGPLSGHAIQREYDAHRRLAAIHTISPTATNTATYAYGPASRLETVALGEHAATYSYHPHSDLIGTITHSADGITPLITTRAYDHLNRLTSISNIPLNASPLGKAYTYNDANQRIRVTAQNDDYWQYDYDPLGQLTLGEKRQPDHTPYAGQTFLYSFDDIGNRTATTNSGETADYAVNLLNQYTQRTVPGSAQITGTAATQAVLTVNNQRTTRQRDGYFHQTLEADNTASAVQLPVSVVAVLQNAGPDEKDIIATHTGSLFIAQTPEVFTYDDDGNILTDGRWQYTWNGENRLIGMETRTNLPPETPRRKLAFHYDSQGRRTAKTVFTPDTNAQWETASTHHFLYDGWNLLSEFAYNTSDSQTNTRWFVWGLDSSGTPQGAGGIGGLLAVIESGMGVPPVVFHPAYDANGNVTEYISTNGTIAARYEYDPFGNTIAQTGPQADNLPFRFSTKYTDDESGLVYYGYRFYSPEMGRWPNRDPIEEEGGVNVYGFAMNSPVVLFDIMGLVPGPCVCPDGSNEGKRAKAPSSYTPTVNGCGPGWAPVVPDDPMQAVGPLFKSCPFVSPCNIHDACYGTCHSGKKKCDDEFHLALRLKCDSCAASLPWGLRVAWRAQCNAMALTYYLAVSTPGISHISYKKGQKEGCEDCCCP